MGEPHNFNLIDNTDFEKIDENRNNYIQVGNLIFVNIWLKNNISLTAKKTYKILTESVFFSPAGEIRIVPANTIEINKPFMAQLVYIKK